MAERLFVLDAPGYLYRAYLRTGYRGALQSTWATAGAAGHDAERPRNADDNVSSGSSGFNNAVLNNTIPLALTGGPVTLAEGDQLLLRVSVRRTCFGGGHNSGTPRLWYNGQAIDSGATRDAGSRFDATIDGSTSNYYLRTGFVLDTTAGLSRTFIDRSVNSSAACPTRPFMSFGTWSTTP